MILGLSGHSCCGKDTFADRLVLRGWIRLSLADPIKRTAQQWWGFSDQQLWGPSEERNRPDPRYPRPDGTFLSPRFALQTLGTEGGRTCYPNTWVDLAIRTANAILSGAVYHPHVGLGPSSGRRPVGVVIPDVRFANELDAIQAAGGQVFRLLRPGADGHVGIPGHASEAEQDGLPDIRFDRIVKVPEGLTPYCSLIDKLAEELP